MLVTDGHENRSHGTNEVGSTIMHKLSVILMEGANVEVALPIIDINVTQINLYEGWNL